MNMDATYSPEDNKLRLYAATRLDSELYERVKAAGYRWAPKQELFVAPRWTPQAEDDLEPDVGLCPHCHADSPYFVQRRIES